MAAVAVLIGGGGSGTQATQESVDASRPVLNDPVVDSLPAPTGVKVTRVGPKRVTVTWDAAEPGSDDTFRYAVVDPVEAPDYVAATPPVEVAVGPGRVCIRVVRTRVGEPSSDSAIGCSR